MSPLSSEQWPGTSNACTVEGVAVLVFAVTVGVIAIPARTLREFDAKEGVDRPNRVQNARVVRGAQPEPYQGESVGTDHVRCALHVLSRWTVLDGHKTLRGRRRAIRIGWSDADVVAFDSDLLGKIAA